MSACTKPTLERLFTYLLAFISGSKVMVPNVPKRNVFVQLPFLESTLFQIRKKLQILFSDKFTSFNLKIFFTSPVRVKSFFTFKDKLPKMLLSVLVYWYSVVAPMLPIMERPDAILKSEFENI